MILSEIKSNPPWVNICWGIFLPLVIMTICGMVFGSWHFIFVLIAPPFLMTLGIYLLFVFPESSTDILAVEFGFVVAVLMVLIGGKFRAKLWGQALIIMGFWLWNVAGVCGLGLQG